MIRAEINQPVRSGVGTATWQRWSAAIADGAKVRGRCFVSVAIIGGPAMRKLNRTYRHHDRVTDVLSFPEGDNQLRLSHNERYLGEVLICYPQAMRQAREHAHSVRRELAILFIHGVVHLLGYDHVKRHDAATMEPLERVILSRLKV